MSTWFRRVSLFVVTNLAVLLLLGFVIRFLGIDVWLTRSSGLDFASLLVFSAVFGFAGSLVSLALSKAMARWSTGARIIVEPRSHGEIWLVDTVRRLAGRAGIGTPDVAVYPSPDPNAFATGARRDHALVAVSTGLLESMPPREVEAVLAHEISHVTNGDMVTLTLLQGVLNTFVIFLSRLVGFLVDQALFRSDSRSRIGPGYWITSLVLQVLLGLLASMVVMAYSRRREFRADEGAARLAGAGAMIEALQTLGRVHEPAALPRGMRAFGVRGGGVFRLLASHPPIEARIARLRQLAGQA
ncbi:MAG: protease HtpX [Deltaproteobacteria bacterium]|nr:protease HtpX [Deltaproteobacteria bacterium]